MVGGLCIDSRSILRHQSFTEFHTRVTNRVVPAKIPTNRIQPSTVDWPEPGPGEIAICSGTKLVEFMVEERVEGKVVGEVRDFVRISVDGENPLKTEPEVLS